VVAQAVQLEMAEPPAAREEEASNLAVPVESKLELVAIPKKLASPAELEAQADPTILGARVAQVESVARADPDGLAQLPTTTTIVATAAAAFPILTAMAWAAPRLDATHQPANSVLMGPTQ